MAKFSDELTIIRRFLRDPDKNIWSDLDIVTFWNDSLQEIFTKVGYEERAHSYSYPPKWVWSYMYDHEYRYTDGDRYKCLNIWQSRDAVVCYPWEPGYYNSNSDTPDDGTRFIHPWESVYVSPADYVPCPLHASFHKMKFCAYDEDPLIPIDRKSLMLQDRNYRTTTGTPTHYWRPDIEGNQFVLYGRPSSVTWDDVALIIQSPLDTFTDTGGFKIWESDLIDESDVGIVTDSIDIDGQIFMIFEIMPTDISEQIGDWYQLDIDIPEHFIKYVRYGCLERCYGANTDGFIPSLRDYWMTRKVIGIKAIKKFKALRMSNRTYRLGGDTNRYFQRSRLKLPSTYPATYP